VRVEKKSLDLGKEKEKCDEWMENAGLNLE
jgi:hypothetical protein